MSSTFDDLAVRLDGVRSRVDRAAERCGRDPADVGILLAGKGQPVELIRAAIDAGFDLIGENRVQELAAKASALAATPHQTHLIGSLQRNKARAAVAHVDCVQTVADMRLAERLDGVLAEGGGTRRLDVMIQVNCSGEGSKSGCRPEEALDLAAGVAGLGRLRLVGWMTVGLNSPDHQAVAAAYARLRDIREDGAKAGLDGARELSMGMSGDFDIAIAEGSTMVRVGAAAFGPRIA